MSYYRKEPYRGSRLPSRRNASSEQQTDLAVSTPNKRSQEESSDANEWWGTQAEQECGDQWSRASGSTQGYPNDANDADGLDPDESDGEDPAGHSHFIGGNRPAIPPRKVGGPKAELPDPLPAGPVNVHKDVKEYVGNLVKARLLFQTIRARASTSVLKEAAKQARVETARGTIAKALPKTHDSKPSAPKDNGSSQKGSGSVYSRRGYISEAAICASSGGAEPSQQRSKPNDTRRDAESTASSDDALPPRKQPQNTKRTSASASSASQVDPAVVAAKRRRIDEPAAGAKPKPPVEAKTRPAAKDAPARPKLMAPTIPPTKIPAQEVPVRPNLLTPRHRTPTPKAKAKAQAAPLEPKRQIVIEDVAVDASTGRDECFHCGRSKGHATLFARRENVHQPIAYSEADVISLCSFCWHCYELMDYAFELSTLCPSMISVLNRSIVALVRLFFFFLEWTKACPGDDGPVDPEATRTE